MTTRPDQIPALRQTILSLAVRGQLVLQDRSDDPVPLRVSQSLCLGQRMMLIRCGEATTPSFLEMVLNSPLITEIAKSKTTGGAAPRINVSTVKGYSIPIPPLAEQHRIVAKVEELMAVCDRLEAQLTTAQTESRRLLEAVLHEALAPAG